MSEKEVEMRGESRFRQGFSGRRVRGELEDRIKRCSVLGEVTSDEKETVRREKKNFEL